MRTKFSQSVSSLLAIFLLAGTTPLMATDQTTTTFKIPPVRIPLDIKDQHVTIAASGVITLLTKERGLNILKLQLSADLSDLQQNITEVLSSALDKEDRCGDHIATQHATLSPVAPASIAVVELHYERWGCAKVFGKQEARRLVGGNAVMQLKFTPAISEDNTSLRLVPEVGPIEGDGSLGELLRSGALGEMLREKIRNAILSALQKATDLKATLPPAVQGHATLETAEFQDGGGGRLLAVLGGEIRVTNEQIQALSKQLKERMAGR